MIDAVNWRINCGFVH